MRTIALSLVLVAGVAAVNPVPTPRPTWAPATTLEQCIARRAKREAAVHLPLASTFIYNLRNAPALEKRETAELKQLRNFRGISKGWYQDTWDKVWPYLCYKMLTAEEARGSKGNQVPCDDEEAHGKGTSSAIVLSGTLGQPGAMCERKGGCYWPEPVRGKPRQARWTAAQLQKSSEDAGVYLNSVVPGAAVLIKDYNGDSLPAGKGNGSLVLAAPAILLVLTLLGWCYWTWFGCLCNCGAYLCKKRCKRLACFCCGGRRGKEGGYTKCQRRWPLALYLLFVGGIVGSAFVALSGNDMVTDGGDKFVNSSQLLLNDLGTMGHRGEEPLHMVKASVINGSARISAEIGDTSFLSVGLNGIANRVESFGQKYGAERHFPTGCTVGNPECIACGDSCTKLGAKVQSAVDDMRAGLSSTLENLRETVTDMQVKIRDAKDDTIKSVDAGIDSMQVLPDAVKSMNDQLESGARKPLRDTKDKRKLGVLLLFAASLGVAALGLVGAFASFFCRGACGRRFAHLLHLTWFLGSVVALIGFTVSLVMLILSSGVSDACQFVDIITNSSLEPYIGKAKADGPDACFRRESLLVAFNMTQKFDFTAKLQAQLDTATSTDVNATFATATKGIADMADEMAALNRSKFGYPPSAINDWLDSVNTNRPAGCAAAKAAPFTLANINAPYDDQSDPEPTGSFRSGFDEKTDSGEAYLNDIFADANGCNGAWRTSVVDAWKQLREIERAFVDVDAFILDMQSDMGDAADTLAAPPPTTCFAGCAAGAACQAPSADGMCASAYKYTDSPVLAVKKLEADTVALNAGVMALGGSVVADVITSIDDFKCEAFCDFVPNGYVRVVQGDMCSVALGGVFRIMVSFFSLSICTLLLVIFSVVLNKRLSTKGPGVHRESLHEGHGFGHGWHLPKKGKGKNTPSAASGNNSNDVKLGAYPMPSGAVALPGMQSGAVANYNETRPAQLV